MFSQRNGRSEAWNRNWTKKNDFSRSVETTKIRTQEQSTLPKLATLTMALAESISPDLAREQDLCTASQVGTKDLLRTSCISTDGSIVSVVQSKPSPRTLSSGEVSRSARVAAFLTKCLVVLTFPSRNFGLPWNYMWRI